MNDAQFLGPLTDEERAILTENHFQIADFLELRRRYLDGELSPAKNRVSGVVSAPLTGELRPMASRYSEAGERYIRLGRSALERGEVGALILNGGMATRFGGAVKGCVEVFDGLSFLGLKLHEARRRGPRVPVLLMNSFATHDQTIAHLEQHDYFGFEPENLLAFRQNVSIRLTPDGQIFRKADATETLYAPGHGDLPDAVGRGALEQFRARGGKYLLMSNVDNILATLDPLIIGMHIDAQQRGIEMTVESVEKDPGDTGGMPARVDGHLQVVEAFRFPASFDLDMIPVFNTNTFIFNADALDQDFELTWFVVEKKVDDQGVIQFERLAGELSTYLKTEFLVVPRRDEESRFLPIKTREDLDQHRAFIKSQVQSWQG
ncbi:MAG: UTP--glucose-1-phosphate uridylyltransferase [Bradymonadaceae bacterium]|nr:UTP--glucose-1-phosphate uridylyltransferase [Lujinxingiaceae bacterium]